MTIYEDAKEAGRLLCRIKYHLDPSEWQAFLEAIPFFVAMETPEDGPDVDTEYVLDDPDAQDSAQP